eukprot:gene40696-55029_t
MSGQEFRDYVTSRGVNFDSLSNEEKRQWSKTFDKSERAGTEQRRKKLRREKEGISKSNIPVEERSCQLLFHFEEIAVEEEDSGILSKAESNEVEEMPIEEEKNTIPSLKLVLDEIPIEFRNRYGELPASIYVRRCYLELYDMVTEIMLGEDCRQPAFLFTGIPGIGKSMFLIYFLCQYSRDDRFEDKRFAFEVCSGQYHYY